ncbi:MAG: hypothetical protein IKW99_08485 [Bacteroidales bacterium]|nr:hypothetical protein [Bacteroidales bacterium]
MNKTIDELIEGYFEGTLSDSEETSLKVFLTSEEGQDPEYDEVRAVMGYFAAGRAVILSEAKDLAPQRSKTTTASIYPDRARSAARRGGLRSWLLWPRFAAIAASLAIIVTLGVSLYNKSNVCVSYVSGQKITDKEVVMNDVDNILADLLSDRVDMEEQLVNIFGE